MNSKRLLSPNKDVYYFTGLICHAIRPVRVHRQDDIKPLFNSSSPAIEFASCDGKRLFSEALQSGTMEGFFRLISYFQTQSEPAYCGLASLSVVLNALAIDPGRKWKGPWRWFDESMLDCCEPLEKVKAEGITFGKVACLAHCAGAKVEAYRANESNFEDFRKHVIKCTTSEDCHVIASYHRRPFQQTGTGHFSPIGGYHAGKDMALILDVARFKYPPHWVPLSLLWDAINTVDDATGLLRGYIMLISRLPMAPSLLYTLSCRDDNWVKVAKYLREDVPKLLRSETVNSVQALFSLLFRTLPASAADFIKWVVEVRRQEEGVSSLSPEERERLNLKDEVLCQVRGTRLFKLAKELLSDPAFGSLEERRRRRRKKKKKNYKQSKLFTKLHTSQYFFPLLPFFPHLSKRTWEETKSSNTFSTTTLTWCAGLMVSLKI
ncbi:Glutathione gamma-glutamylcysteinyltransferase 1 [Rhynchospora pubera]|uniref:glutathione gamma-glutamylcysteinyltransferase n=1 Tax=Rhynchospora pubera TaxID=906938 RepID=A0AAV8EDJ4_9POAL|nr:Glutathione gamma-glutamylcysteinyltransferase 1 [Rhynchospora pubera]